MSETIDPVALELGQLQLAEQLAGAGEVMLSSLLAQAKE
jgi:hypothetical protein